MMIEVTSFLMYLFHKLHQNTLLVHSLSRQLKFGRLLLSPTLQDMQKELLSGHSLNLQIIAKTVSLQSSSFIKRFVFKKNLELIKKKPVICQSG
ncbi:hypothetical protein kam1_1293 [Methylacidiphilum kamchatkense Kam1]|uniref:Uncharacterized protein n=1 Tax=Methylacidiphilum kamchatkense Kam1 TaxID=1202785 RepID=A0A516TMQ1_9BACT|nr:hypothetical protein kam1_1293 [Methylacidiphilum kamchatkense Kam1]